MKYKLVSQLEAATTAMCYVEWNGMHPKMMPPIQFSASDFYEVYGGGYAVKFNDFTEGGVAACGRCGYGNEAGRGTDAVNSDG